MIRHTIGACLLAGICAVAAPAAAESVFDTLPFTQRVTGKAVYLVPYGGRMMLARDLNGPSIANLPRSFNSVSVSLIGAAHSSQEPDITLQRTDDCSAADGPCYTIHAGDAAEGGRWTLRVFRPENGEPLRGGEMDLEPGMPMFTLDGGGPGADLDRQHPRLVVSRSPVRASTYAITELKFDAAQDRYALNSEVLISLDDPLAEPKEIFTPEKTAVNSYYGKYNVVDRARAGDSAEWRIKRYSPCRVYTGTQCYWMENTSGNWCYVPSTIFKAETPERCFELNSCGEGGGQSGGGCYKWSTRSDGARIPYEGN